jgi:hypothetical protein
MEIMDILQARFCSEKLQKPVCDTPAELFFRRVKQSLGIKRPFRDII